MLQLYFCYLKVPSRVSVVYLKEQNPKFFTVIVNKFLNYVFNIILELNNHTWKILQNYFFVEKNESQISGFVVAKKAPTLWKKNYYLLILPVSLCGYDLQNGVQKFF